jgi:tellurite resistance protein TerC
MPAPVEITPWHWVGFIVCVLICLAFDLGLFHRKAHIVAFKEALAWTALWAAIALVFGLGLAYFRGRKDALEFSTGYFIELSLSMDNVFVIALIFAHFRVPPQYQHRLLFWGILGALVMRGLMIGVGAALISRFDWLLYAFGCLLLYTGAKMLFAKNQSDPEKTIVVRIARRLLPISREFDGPKFVTTINGRKFLTPLFLVLLLVETSDLIFAVDSIPAIFGVTRQAFIVFTSNVFAILGLRSLYFVLAGAIKQFRYLNIGLSIILVFIGVKMLIDPHDNPPRWYQYDIPDGTALIVVMVIIAVAILISIVVARREEGTRPGAKGAGPTP